ncbi:OAS [Mytilus coruscus]|uniref:OAS n=1 Tax=Mytilus coruscus TaxID=42192 RepID=A0A6J8CYI1_MYTCO|nr:OAS [Mytilus coruscus]
MFVVSSIWISHRFRDIQLKINSRVQNHLNETEEHAMDLNDDTDERIDRISDYDSINENEMLPFPSVVVLGDKDLSLDTDNIATNHACIHENTSSSDNSYLEVIDDSTYLNPYQSIDVQQDSIIVHDYCTTSDINFLDMCSPKLIEKSSNEQYSTCDTDVSTNHDKLDVTAQYLPNKYAAAQFKERRDHEVLQTYSSQFESTEINLRFSENIEREILFEKTPFAEDHSVVIHKDRMVRQYSFEFRRQNPGMFPEACGTCIPQRRFKRPVDHQRHDRDKHGHCPASFNNYSLRTPGYTSYSALSATHGTQSHLSTIYRSPFFRNDNELSPPSSPLYDVSKYDLDKFVKDELEPDTAYNLSCCAVVHRLCEFMKNNFPAELRPAQIIKGGSLGKGTAVKGKSDADLVVFLADRNFDSIPYLQNHMDKVLNDMETYLRHGKCTIEGKTFHAVKVSVSCHKEHTHDVDILPSVNILDKYSKKEIYQMMMGRSETDQSFYSAALVPLQMQFVSERPTKLKSLIRLVKYWRKTSFNESTGNKRLPTSYPFGSFYNVLKALVNYRHLAYVCEDNYSSSDVKSSLKDSWHVMDPANPFNNLMGRCDCWEEVKSIATICLDKPLLNDLSGDVGWI